MTVQLRTLEHCGRRCQSVYRSLNYNEQVCVQPPPSALNVTLPAFAAGAERRRLLHCARSCRLIHPPAHTALSCKPAAAAVDRWDRQTVGRTDPGPLHRPCCACYAASVNKRTDMNDC